MKSRGFAAMVAIAVFALVSAGITQEVCSAQTAKGRYAITCTGWVSLDPNNPTALVPYASQGICTDEVVGEGLVSSCDPFRESFGGLQFDDVYTSTAATIEPECHGSITFQVTGGVTELTGGPFPVQISFVALENGKELRSFGTDTGTVTTCTLRLMSRNTHQQDQTE